MLQIVMKPQETYQQAIARMLREQATPELQDLAQTVAYELEKACTPEPDSLHPSACDLPTHERMALLAETFPTLRGRPGVRPWNCGRLMAEENAAWTSTASREALRFVCSVWNVRNETGERFSVARAMGVWDRKHRAAFQAWARDPWGA